MENVIKEIENVFSKCGNAKEVDLRKLQLLTLVRDIAREEKNKRKDDKR